LLGQTEQQGLQLRTCFVQNPLHNR